VTLRGLPVYLDATRASGLFLATRPYTGFGTGWIDFDNDGRLDLFVANGAVTLREEQRGQPVPFKEKNLLIHNEGGGRFVDVTESGGDVLQFLEVTRGAAFGDIDNDGDVDIVITNNNGPARLLLNQVQGTNWVSIQAEGQAIGSRITLLRENMPNLVRRIYTDSSYCSASDSRVHFGLGSDASIKAIEITWPDGKTQRIETPAPNRIHKVKR
jgi:hypothetical protein